MAGTLRFRSGRRENVRHWRTAPPNEGEARVKAQSQNGPQKIHPFRPGKKHPEVLKELRGVNCFLFFQLSKYERKAPLSVYRGDMRGGFFKHVKNYPYGIKRGEQCYAVKHGALADGLAVFIVDA